jgi:hypothetical protein
MLSQTMNSSGVSVRARIQHYVFKTQKHIATLA